MKERRKEIRKFIEAERDVTLSQLCAKFNSRIYQSLLFRLQHAFIFDCLDNIYQVFLRHGIVVICFEYF